MHTYAIIRGHSGGCSLNATKSYLCKGTRPHIDTYNVVVACLPNIGTGISARRTIRLRLNFKPSNFIFREELEALLHRQPRLGDAAVHIPSETRCVSLKLSRICSPAKAASYLSCSVHLPHRLLPLPTVEPIVRQMPSLGRRQDKLEA